MQYSISGQQLEITDAIRDYVSNKLDRLARHYDQITNIHVVLHVDRKLSHRAEATVHVPGSELFADAASPTLYAAIDALADKLHRQILRHKGKVIDRQHRQAH